MLALAASPATAQARDAQPDSDIVVTAQKTGAQSILQVPATISALSAETLNAARVNGLSDIARLNPSINFEESLGRAFNYISIRGVSSTQGGTPTVQVYVDGYTSGIARSQLNTTLFALERVEVLEGPQATLYGRNSIGGVINYITKKPGNVLEAEARMSVAQYGETTAMSRVAGPLVADHLFAEVSVAHHQTGGFLTNSATGERIDKQQDIGVRAALRAVYDRTTIDVSGTYSHANDGCADCSYVPAGYVIPGIVARFLQPPPADTSLRSGTVDLNANTHTIDQDSPHYLKITSRTFVGTIEHDFGVATLTSITGYSRVKTDMAFDIDRTANRNPLIDSYVGVGYTDTSYSEELRLSGGGQGRLRWVLGGYYSKIKEVGATALGGPLVSLDYLTSKNAAAFANVEVPIGDFSIGGGVRYDHEINYEANDLAAISGKTKSSEVLPHVTASYHFGSRTMVYATVSKGYKSGGLNIATTTVPRSFAPEFLWNYEAGIKGRFLDDKLTLALSGFHMDWTNRQVQLTDPTGTFVYQANLGKAHIDGAELTAGARLAPGLTVDGGVTYLRGKIDRYVDGAGVSTFFGVNPDLKGKTLPNTPPLRVSVSPQWIVPIADGRFDLRTRADVVYTSKRYFDAQNLLRQDPFALVNLYFGIENKRFELGVFANNAFNQGYRTDGTLSTLTGPLLTAGAPRIIGVRARVKV